MGVLIKLPSSNQFLKLNFSSFSRPWISLLKNRIEISSFLICTSIQVAHRFEHAYVQKRTEPK